MKHGNFRSVEDEHPMVHRAMATLYGLHTFLLKREPKPKNYGKPKQHRQSRSKKYGQRVGV